MAISGISSAGGANYYSQIASGSRLNTAADGASELAISQKLESVSRGMDAGTENLEDGKSALKIQDGALAGVTDSLERMHELALKASNGLMSDEDKSYIQAEIDQLKQGITDLTKSANFNGINLIDGSLQGAQIVTGPGTGTMELTGADATLESLGIADFDVTGDFDISKLTDALDSINAQRAQNGSAYNAFEHAVDYNKLASFNQTSAQSRIEDTDIPSAVSEMKKREALMNYQIIMQKRRMEDEQNKVTRLFQ